MPWHVSGVRQKFTLNGRVCDSHAISNGEEVVAFVLYDPKQHLPCWLDANLIVTAVNEYIAQHPERRTDGPQ